MAMSPLTTPPSMWSIAASLVPGLVYYGPEKLGGT